MNWYNIFRIKNTVLREELQSRLNYYCDFIGVDRIPLEVKKLGSGIYGKFSAYPLGIVVSTRHDKATLMHEFLHYLRETKGIRNSSVGIADLDSFSIKNVATLLDLYPVNQVYEEVIVRSLENETIEKVKEWYESLPSRLRNFYP